jgi:hypothetical protein
VAGHLLALEHLAGVLALTGRTVRAVRERDAVGGAKAAEVPALHGALETLALAGAGHVHELAGDEMVGGDLGSDFDQVLGADAELGKLALGFDVGHREATARRLGEARRLTGSRAHLDRGVSVLIGGALRKDLKLLELQNRHRHMLSGIREDAGHADFLCNHSGTHLFAFLPLYSRPTRGAPFSAASSRA